LTISDVYWTIIDALLFLITSPGKAGLRVQTGDRHTRGEWRGVQGSPGGEGAERDSLDTPSHRIPGPIGMERQIQENRMISENLRRDPIITTAQTTPPPPSR
jgi:hypothetical protein